MAGRDPAHEATTSGPEPPYREVWSTPIEGGPEAGPVVAGKRVVVVGREAVVALDAASGKLLWQVLRPEGPAGPAVMIGDMVVHATGTGSNAGVVGRTLADGIARWRVATGSDAGGLTGVAGVLTGESDRVYVGTGEGTLLALDPSDGKTIWTFDLPGSIAAAPAVSEGHVVVVARDEANATTTLAAVDAVTGDEAWRFTPPALTPGAGAAGIRGGRVFVGLGDARVHAFDLQVGVERWSSRTPAATLGTPLFFTEVQTPAVPGDPVVADVLHVARFDAGTGEESWDFRFPGLLATAAPIVAGGAVLIGDGRGTLAAIDLDEGVLVWRERLGTRPLSAAAADGTRVYVATLGSRGRVVALEHDPEGSLIRVESDSTLFPVQALLNFAAAAAAVGLVAVVLFRFRPGGRGRAAQETP
jgi:outer membrane protein assembly factor BamB